jgi:hypothetical protein
LNHPHPPTNIIPEYATAASVIKTDMLILYTEIISVLSGIHTKHTTAPVAKQRIPEC